MTNESVDCSCTMAGPLHDKVCWKRPDIPVPEDYTFRCYRWVEEAFPREVRLVVNDSWRDNYRLSWKDKDGKEQSALVKLHPHTASQF